MALSLDSMAQGAPTAQVEVRFDHPENFRDASLDSHGYERGADLCDENPDRTCRSSANATCNRASNWSSTSATSTWPGASSLAQPGLRCALHARDHLADDRPHLHPQPAAKPDRQAQERVSDKMYLSRPGRVASSSDRLYAEKAMLSDWFRQRFAAHPAS
jgi:hypothetical protein